MKRYLIGFAALMSQGINHLFFLGHHDMTLSARCYVQRAEPGWGWGYRTLNRIFFWQRDHCRESFGDDVTFAAQVVTWQQQGVAS